MFLVSGNLLGSDVLIVKPERKLMQYFDYNLRTYFQVIENKDRNFPASVDQLDL